jgi:DNA-binding MarR family transcriptional regulator
LVEALPERRDSKTIVVKNSDDADMIVELASYLDVLGSVPRLRILRIIEKQPLDIESISHELYRMRIKETTEEKGATRENTEKHVKKLLDMGLVRKKPGEKNGRAVMNYIVVNGGVETALRTVKKVLKLELSIDLEKEAKKVDQTVSEEFCSTTIRVLGGVDDGRLFSLKKNIVMIGREDPEQESKYDPKNDIVLSAYYKAVSRVWKPHAILSFENGEWHIEQGEGVNSTSLWGKKLVKGRKEKLKDADIIRLADADRSVKLLFSLPKYQESARE